MFEQQPRDAPRIFKSPPAPPGSTGPYWNLIRKASCAWLACSTWPCHRTNAAPPRVQVANMKWGTVYTLLVVGGVGIMAADMVRGEMLAALARRR